MIDVPNLKNPLKINVLRIENLDKLTGLEMLELGDNKIRKVENLDTLANLTELYLGKNKISKIENLEKLKKLKILSIQANRFNKDVFLINRSFCNCLADLCSRDHEKS